MKIGPKLPFRLSSQYDDPKQSMSSIRDMIAFNIYWESQAIEGYSMMAEKAHLVGDESTAKLFEHILGEEKEHLRELADQLNRVYRS